MRGTSPGLDLSSRPFDATHPRIHSCGSTRRSSPRRQAASRRRSLSTRSRSRPAAASLARRLGRTAEAKRHFEAAERFYRRILDAGEIYSLESLARLYLDAGANLEEARALARRNLEFKRDRSAIGLARDLSVPVPAR